jgi:hypothetical protein
MEQLSMYFEALGDGEMITAAEFRDFHVAVGADWFDDTEFELWVCNVWQVAARARARTQRRARTEFELAV